MVKRKRRPSDAAERAKWRKVELDASQMMNLEGFVGLEELTDYDPSLYASTNLHVCVPTCDVCWRRLTDPGANQG